MGRKIEGAALIFIALTWAIPAAALPDHIFGTTWMRPVVELGLWLMMSVYIWRGTQSERTGA